MPKNQGVRSGGARGLFILLALAGCGKSDDASRGSITQPQLPYAAIQVGDSVTGRMVQKTPGRTTQYGTLTEVVDVLSDGSSYRVDKYRQYPSGRVLESSQWQKTAVLEALEFTSYDELVRKCAGLSGQMVRISFSSGRTMDACRVRTRWMNEGVLGSGETYLGPVPFGIVRRHWASNDGGKRFQFEVISFKSDGRTVVL